MRRADGPAGRHAAPPPVSEVGPARPRRPSEPDGAAEATLDEAMELMHFAFRRVVEGPDARLAASGLGRLHHRVLYVVGKNPGIRVLELADLLGVSRQAVHGPLVDLRGLGLVDDQPSADDGRARALHLTDDGRRFERELAGLQHDAFASAFAEAGPEAEAAWRQVMHLLGGGRRLRR